MKILRVFLVHRKPWLNDRPILVYSYMGKKLPLAFRKKKINVLNINLVCGFHNKHGRLTNK